MMKFVYIALMPVLVVLIAIYAVFMLTYEPPVINENMTTLSNNLIKNSPTLDRNEINIISQTKEATIPSDVWKNSLFDPSRGSAATLGSSGDQGLKNVELIGVFDDGKMRGAIIYIKTAESVGGYPQQPEGFPGYSNINQAGAQQKSPVKQKVIFKVGERLPNGLVVESVGDEFVMLKGGSNSVKLRMSFYGEDVTKRETDVQNKAQPQGVTIISAGGSGAPSSSGGQNPFVIKNTSEGSMTNQPPTPSVFTGYGR